MKKVLFSTSAIFVLIALGIFTEGRTYYAGRNYGQHLIYLDALGAAGSSLSCPNLTPQTREFIKAQYYYYAWQAFASHLQDAHIVDYGPIDETLIHGTEPFVFHADSANGYYQILQEHHVFRK